MEQIGATAYLRDMDQAVKAQMLERWRDSVDEQRMVLVRWVEGDFRFVFNGVDETNKTLADIQASIDHMDDLIARVDASDA